MSSLANRPECYDQAAIRHFDDAEHLASNQRWNGAAHLIGFAAECALKYAIASLRPGQDVPHRHIPELLSIARKHLQQQNHRGLYALIGQADYFADWTVNDRYSADSAISPSSYELWRSHARRTIGAAGLRRTP